ncbi:hypothetical protein ILUMI_03528 [Ignelater luminosus]|uniref:Uncharacterized protein n=1 Tax=Ignelater luminosus TaxID=2038154 RepID=A0A8K0GFF0_IGNLU|nr:hypothetical protein ILUMI_03528 [Ignelater luminosus]
MKILREAYKKEVKKVRRYSNGSTASKTAGSPPKTMRAEEGRFEKAELQQTVDEISDIQYKYEIDDNDSVDDPDYKNSYSSYSDSDYVNIKSKRPRLETDFQINRDIRNTIASLGSDISFSHSSDKSETKIADLHDLRVIWVVKNRKFNPKPVTEATLRKRAMIARESNTHVIVGKWRDKRKVLCLTIEEVPEMTDIQIKMGVVQKASSIAKYNSINPL